MSSRMVFIQRCDGRVEPLRQAAGKIVPLKTHATLGIAPTSSTDPRGDSKVTLALDGTAGNDESRAGSVTMNCCSVLPS